MADSSAKNQCSLHESIKTFDLDIVREAYQHDSSSINILDPNIEWSALYKAIVYEQFDIARFLLEKGADPNLPNKIGETPIHYAVEIGNLDFVNLLLKYKANPSLKQSDGNTALHIACKKDNMDIIKLLVAHKVDMNVQNKLGRTSLHFVSGNENTEAYKLLVKEGADPNLKDKWGKKPKQLVAMFSEEAIITPKASTAQIIEPKPKPSREVNRSREIKIEDKENINEQDRSQMLHRKQASMNQPRTQKNREQILQSLTEVPKIIQPPLKKTISQDRVLGDLTNTIVAHNENLLDNPVMRPIRPSQRRVSEMQGQKMNLDEIDRTNRMLKQLNTMKRPMTNTSSQAIPAELSLSMTRKRVQRPTSNVMMENKENAGIDGPMKTNNESNRQKPDKLESVLFENSQNPLEEPVLDENLLKQYRYHSNDEIISANTNCSPVEITSECNLSNRSNTENNTSHSPKDQSEIQKADNKIKAPQDSSENRSRKDPLENMPSRNLLHSNSMSRLSQNDLNNVHTPKNMSNDNKMSRLVLKRPKSSLGSEISTDPNLSSGQSIPKTTFLNIDSTPTNSINPSDAFLTPKSFISTPKISTTTPSHSKESQTKVDIREKKRVFDEPRPQNHHASKSLALIDHASKENRDPVISQFTPKAQEKDRSITKPSNELLVSNAICEKKIRNEPISQQNLPPKSVGRASISLKESQKVSSDKEINNNIISIFCQQSVDKTAPSHINERPSVSKDDMKQYELELSDEKRMAEWLSEIGLEQLRLNFADNGYVYYKKFEQDYKECKVIFKDLMCRFGIDKIGHRCRITMKLREDTGHFKRKGLFKFNNEFEDRKLEFPSVENWLCNLGYEDYVQNFLDNGFDSLEHVILQTAYKEYPFEEFMLRDELEISDKKSQDDILKRLRHVYYVASEMDSRNFDPNTFLKLLCTKGDYKTCNIF